MLTFVKFSREISGIGVEFLANLMTVLFSIPMAMLCSFWLLIMIMSWF